MNTQPWHRPATIERNHFKFKSLSCWAYNVAVGCGHVFPRKWDNILPPLRVRILHSQLLHRRGCGALAGHRRHACRFCYALHQLFQFERVAYDLRVPDNVLHLWPDPGLCCTKQTPPDIRNWLHRHWAKISRWPSARTE